MRAVDADAILHTHKLEQKAIGKDWGVDDLATAVMAAPTIDAIPLEWLEAHKTEYLDDWGEEPISVEAVLRTWRKEQEAYGT